MFFLCRDNMWNFVNSLPSMNDQNIGVSGSPNFLFSLLYKSWGTLPYGFAQLWLVSMPIHFPARMHACMHAHKRYLSWEKEEENTIKTHEADKSSSHGLSVVPSPNLWNPNLSWWILTNMSFEKESVWLLAKISYEEFASARCEMKFFYERKIKKSIWRNESKALTD